MGFMEELNAWMADADYGMVVKLLLALAVLSPLMILTGPLAGLISPLLGLISLVAWLYFGYMMGKKKKFGYEKVAVTGAKLGVVTGAISGVLIFILALVGFSMMGGGMIGPVGMGYGAAMGTVGGIILFITSVIGGAIGGAILAVIGRLFASFI